MTITGKISEVSRNRVNVSNKNIRNIAKEAIRLYNSRKDKKPVEMTRYGYNWTFWIEGKEIIEIRVCNTQTAWAWYVDTRGCSLL